MNAPHAERDSVLPGLTGDAVPGLTPARGSKAPVKRQIAFVLLLGSFVAAAGWVAVKAISRDAPAEAPAPDVASATAERPRIGDVSGNTVPSAAPAASAAASAAAASALRIPAIDTEAPIEPLRVVPNTAPTAAAGVPGSGSPAAAFPHAIDAPVLNGSGLPGPGRVAHSDGALARSEATRHASDDDDPAAAAMRRNLEALRARKAELERLQGQQQASAAVAFSLPAPESATGTRPAGAPDPNGATRTQARWLAQRALTIPKGTLFSCALKTRVVTSTSGLVGCQVQRDVYGHDGRVLLVERGSHLDGEYRIVQLRPGLTRIPVMWTRLLTPHGVTVDLESPATGALGEGGLGGHVDNRWPERIGAAMLLSLIDDAIKYALAGQAGDGDSPRVYLSGTAAQGSRLAEKVLETTINIPPLLHAQPGGLVGVYVARDLDFSTVYALRAVAAEATPNR